MKMSLQPYEVIQIKSNKNDGLSYVFNNIYIIHNNYNFLNKLNSKDKRFKNKIICSNTTNIKTNI